MLFKSAGVPIHGIGIQSHLSNMNVDITTMKVTRLHSDGQIKYVFNVLTKVIKATRMETHHNAMVGISLSDML